MDLVERVSENGSLRFRLRAARKWHVPPTVVLEERTVNTTEWTPRDVQYLLALEVYEESLCPGGDHVLAETSQAKYQDAFLPDRENEVRCHKCKGQHLLQDVLAKEDDAAGLFVPLRLDLDVVERNQQPVPPLPPGLMAPREPT